MNDLLFLIYGAGFVCVFFILYMVTVIYLPGFSLILSLGIVFYALSEFSFWGIFWTIICLLFIHSTGRSIRRSDAQIEADRLWKKQKMIEIIDRDIRNKHSERS